jgi:hypothetical protein
VCDDWLHVQVRTKQLDIAGAEEQVARLEGLLKEAKGATDKVQKEFNALSEKVRAGYEALLCEFTRCCAVAADIPMLFVDVGALPVLAQWQLCRQVLLW